MVIRVCQKDLNRTIGSPFGIIQQLDTHFFQSSSCCVSIIDFKGEVMIPARPDQDFDGISSRSAEIMLFDQMNER